MSPKRNVSPLSVSVQHFNTCVLVTILPRPCTQQVISTVNPSRNKTRIKVTQQPEVGSSAISAPIFQEPIRASKVVPLQFIHSPRFDVLEESNNWRVVPIFIVIKIKEQFPPSPWPVAQRKFRRPGRAFGCRQRKFQRSRTRMWRL